MTKFPDEPKPNPSPAAIVWASNLSQADFYDVYALAKKIDEVAEQARETERKRIFSLSFTEILSEFWKGRKLHAK